MPGDTINSMVGGFHVPSGCGDGIGAVYPFSYKIDSVGTTTIDGQSLRVQYVSTITNFWRIGIGGDEQIVERIGAMNTTHWYGTGSPCVLAGCLSFIRCYSDGDMHYQNPKWQTTNKDCDFTSKLIEPIHEPPSILPNPASDFIELPFEPDEVRLSNALGQVAVAYGFGQKLDVSNLRTGIWFLVLKKDGQWFSTKLVIQR